MHVLRMRRAVYGSALLTWKALNRLTSMTRPNLLNSCHTCSSFAERNTLAKNSCATYDNHIGHTATPLHHEPYCRGHMHKTESVCRPLLGAHASKQAAAGPHVQVDSACQLLTVLFSALLSSTALRFLICSKGSAHFTAKGVVLPSMRCFSSSAAIAWQQQGTHVAGQQRPLGTAHQNTQHLLRKEGNCRKAP